MQERPIELGAGLGLHPAGRPGSPIRGGRETSGETEGNADDGRAAAARIGDTFNALQRFNDGLDNILRRHPEIAATDRKQARSRHRKLKQYESIEILTLVWQQTRDGANESERGKLPFSRQDLTTWNLALHLSDDRARAHAVYGSLKRIMDAAEAYGLITTQEGFDGGAPLLLATERLDALVRQAFGD